jgi:hypothetical protein
MKELEKEKSRLFECFGDGLYSEHDVLFGEITCARRFEEIYLFVRRRVQGMMDEDQRLDRGGSSNLRHTTDSNKRELRE